MQDLHLVVVMEIREQRREREEGGKDERESYSSSGVSRVHQEIVEGGREGGGVRGKDGDRERGELFRELFIR